MKHLATFASRFLREDDGATLVEYGLLVALIAAVCVVIIKSLGTKVNAGFTNVNAQLP